MKVDLTVTFTGDEILAMCREKVAKIETAVPGKFEVNHGRYGSHEVVAEFVPDTDKPVPVPAPAEDSAVAA